MMKFNAYISSIMKRSTAALIIYNEKYEESKFPTSSPKNNAMTSKVNSTLEVDNIIINPLVHTKTVLTNMQELWKLE